MRKLKQDDEVSAGQAAVQAIARCVEMWVFLMDCAPWAPQLKILMPWPVTASSRLTAAGIRDAQATVIFVELFPRGLLSGFVVGA